MKKNMKRTIMVLVVLSLAVWTSVYTPPVYAAEDSQPPKETAMKLCVTSSGRDMESQVDEIFGRASYFIIVDTETMKADAIENSAAMVKRGAGIRAVQVISDKGVDALLTGKIGEKAKAALKEAGIKVYEGASKLDSVKDAVEKFKKGVYKETPAP